MHDIYINGIRIKVGIIYRGTTRLGYILLFHLIKFVNAIETKNVIRVRVGYIGTDTILHNFYGRTATVLSFLENKWIPCKGFPT